MEFSTINEDSVSLGDIVAIFHRRRARIVLTFLLIAAVVVAGTLLMPKQYETHMKVLVKNERADTVVTPDRNDAAEYHGEVMNPRSTLRTGKRLLRCCSK